jgi:hypothetical protein
METSAIREAIRPEKPVYEAEDVRSHVADDACRGEVAVAAPHKRGVGIGQNVDMHRRLEQNEIADLAIVDYLLGQVMHGVLRKIVADAGDKAAFLGEIGELLRFARVRGDRLFAIYVLTGEKRGVRNLVMQMIGQADIYEIDFRIGERVAPLARCTNIGESGAQLIQARFRFIYEPANFSADAVLGEHQRRIAISHGVTFAHPPASAEHGHIHSFNSCLPKIS